MNLRIGFSLAVVLIFMLSMTMVFADENLTSHDGSALALTSGEDDVVDEIPEDESPEIDDMPPEEDGARLVVTSTPSDSRPNLWDEVDLTITVKSVGGVSNNTVVLVFIDGLEYVSHTQDKGSYSPELGEWLVGDLADGEIAHLIIKTIASHRRGADVYVMARSDSVDEYTSENSVHNEIIPVWSSHTVTKEDDPKVRHQEHYKVSDYSEFRSVTKSIDVRNAEAKTTKEPVNNSTVPQDEDCVSQMAPQDDYWYLPWIVVLVVLLAVAGVAYKRYYK